MIGPLTSAFTTKAPSEGFEHAGSTDCHLYRRLNIGICLVKQVACHRMPDRRVMKSRMTKGILIKEETGSDMQYFRLAARNLHV